MNMTSRPLRVRVPSTCLRDPCFSYVALANCAMREKKNHTYAQTLTHIMSKIFNRRLTQIKKKMMERQILEEIRFLKHVQQNTP